MRNILQAYRSRVRSIVTRHKKTVKKTVEDIDRRKTENIRKNLNGR